MAEVIKRLAQVSVASGLTTTLYTAPLLTKATISTLFIVRLSSFVAAVTQPTITIRHILSGEASGAAKQLLVSNWPTFHTASDMRVNDISLNAEDVLEITNSAFEFSYNLYGVENDSSDVNVPKNLGQLAPGALSLSLAYTVPFGLSAVVSTIYVCNFGTTRDQIQVSVLPNGGSPDVSQYVFYNVFVPPGGALNLRIGITLAQGDAVYVYSFTGNTAFNLYGTEL